MQGLAKGLAVIEAFEEGDRRLSVSRVADKTGLDRATARRCLLTLAALGFADYDGKYFSLTPRILRLGHAYLQATPLPVLVQPFLEKLAEETGESASVSVLDGTDIIYVARSSQRRVMTINLNPGSRLPAYCSSMGRVLLAALPLAEAVALLKASPRAALTARTVTDVGALIEILAQVAQDGYAVIDQELEPGLVSIAVPLQNAGGQTVAALNIGAHIGRVAAADMAERYLPLLEAAQREIGRALG
jgi:IclR family transcriptional regulator, pca regulon regulatory protein